MDETKLFIKTISESLKELSKRIHLIGQVVDIFAGSVEVTIETEKPIATKKKPEKKKFKRVTATDVVLEAIQGKDKGADTDFLKEKTGFDSKKIANSIYRLKKKGAIESVGRGVYRNV